MLKSFIIILISLLILACKSKTSSIYEHATRINDDFYKQESEPETSSLTEFNVTELEELLTTDIQNIETYIIQPLSKYFLDPKFLRNRHKLSVNDREKLPKLFEIYNIGIKTVISHSSNELIYIETLPAYKNTMLIGCEKETLLNCEFLDFYKNSSVSSYMAEIFARQYSKNIKEKFLFISLSLTLSNNTTSSSLKTLILSNFMELLDFFLKPEIIGNKFSSLSTTALSLEDRNLLYKYIEILTMILADPEQPDKISLLLSYKPKLMFRFIHSDNFQTIFGQTLRNNLLKTLSKNIDNDYIKNLYKDYIRETQTNNSQSYTNIQKNIAALDSPLINTLIQTSQAQVLSKDKNNNSLLYLYTIDSIFKDTSDIDFSTIWQDKPTECIALLNVLDNYLKTFLLYHVIYTNRQMASIFRRFDKSNPQRFFDYIIDEAKNKIEPSWSNFLRQNSLLKVFFKNEFEYKYKNNINPDLIKKINEVKFLFDELDNNIKLMVTYPNMIMSAFWAKQYGFFDIQEDNMMIKTHYNADNIINEILTGKSYPIFQFTKTSRHESALNEVEAIYAIYYLINLNLLEENKISYATWFNTLLKTYLSSEKTKLREIAQNINTHSLNDSGYNNFLKICQQTQDLTTNDNSNGNLFFSDLKLEDLPKITFMGRTNSPQTIKPMSTILSLVATSQNDLDSLDESLETITSDIHPRINKLQLIKNIFQDSILQTHKTKENKAEIEAIISEINMRLNDIKNREANILAQVSGIDKNASSCIFLFDKIERERRQELVYMEMEHMKDIHLALIALKHMDSNKTKTVKNLKELYPEQRLWNHLLFKDLDNNLPLLEAINKLITEELHYIDIFNINPEYHNDYLINGGIQSTLHDYFYVYRQQDLLFRIASYIQHGYKNLNLNSKPDIIHFEYPQTLEATRKILKTNYYSRIIQKNLYLPMKTQDNLTISLNAFMREASEEFQKTIHWFYDFPSISKYYNYWLRSKAAILKAQYSLIPSLNDNKMQENIKSIQIYLYPIMDFNMKVLDHLNLDKNDIFILENWYNSSAFYEDRATPYRIFENYSGYKGIFDTFYNYLSKPILGNEKNNNSYVDSRLALHRIQDAPAISRQDYYNEAIKYYKTLLQENKILFFPIPKNLYTKLSTIFSSRIKNHLLLMHAFELAIDNYANNNILPKIQFDLNEEENLNPSYLTESVKLQYHYDLQKNFHNLTENFFRLPDMEQ